MNANIKNLFIALALTLLPVSIFAQEDASDMDFSAMEKNLQERIEKMMDRYDNVLKLEDWQMFMLDSIFNHNIPAMAEDVKTFARTKVSNINLYQMVQDKWDEKTYQAVMKILSDEQKNKYLKNLGAAKERKLREKRAEKNGTLD